MMTPPPVFLSASEPDPKRSKEYYDSRRLLNLREAVLAFCAHTLPHFPVVFGGHPAITPLVRSVAARIAFDMRLEGPVREAATLPRPVVLMFQSGLFVDRRASREEEVITEPLDRKGEPTEKPGNGWRNESLLLMRYEMLGRPLSTRFRARLSEHDQDHWLLRYRERFGEEREVRFGTYDFSAAVFIGGMEGVEREFHIFRSFHPAAPTFPIGTTGTACTKLLDQVRPELAHERAEELYSETAYSLLMQRILPPPSRASSVADAVGWRARETPQIRLEQHADPDGLDRPFIDFKPQSRPQGAAHE
jgi:SLOG cluster3 family